MKRYWHQHPETVDRLAAEYALGTLAAPARRRLETLMKDHADIARAVQGWHQRLGGVLAAQQPLPVDPAGWQRLEHRLFAPPRPEPPKPAWWLRWLSPVPAGALALGLLLGSVLTPLWEASRSSTQLPESYVGVLADAAGQPGLIVSSLRKGLTVDLKQVSRVAVPEGQTLYLWTIDKTGQARGVSAIPSGAFVSVPLSRPADETFFPAVELAVSLESVGASPAQPSGPFVYRGLCGKLWKLQAP